MLKRGESGEMRRCDLRKNCQMLFFGSLSMYDLTKKDCYLEHTTMAVA